MTSSERVAAILRAATLPRVRRLLHTTTSWPVVLALAVPFVVVEMLIGGMLTLQSLGGQYYVQLVWSSGGTGWWNYPELFAVQSWGYLAVPFLAGVTMVLVSIGVGIGVSVGIALARSARRSREIPEGGPGVAGAAAGAGPAIAGLATLGACCCSTCAGAAGVAVVAAVSGASPTQLLAQSWFLQLVPLVFVYLSLLAQERVLAGFERDCSIAQGSRRRRWSVALLRVGLLIGGVTWSLAMLVEWTQQDPTTAGPALWYHWLMEHQLLAGLAVFVGLFPSDAVRWARALGSNRAAPLLRFLLLVAGATWGIGVPPVLVGVGLGGFVNELFGYVGVPAMWGAAPVDAPLGVALVFHWTFQHLLLAGFAIALALRPSSVLHLVEYGWPAERADPGTSRAVVTNAVDG